MDEDLQYVVVITAAILLGLVMYWGLGPLVDLAAAHVVPALCMAVVSGLWGGVALRRLIVSRRRRETLIESIDDSLWRRYQEVRKLVEGFDSLRRRLVGKDLLPTVVDVVEVRLPRLVARRNRLQVFLAGAGEDSRLREIEELSRRRSAETDPELRSALEDNLQILQETNSSYEQMTRALRLCELRIANVEGQLGNLVAKLRMVELIEEDEEGPSELFDGIRRDLSDLEEALVLGGEVEGRLLGGG